MKTVGFVPVRMAASRFPGKPLHPILEKPLLEHCFERAKLYEGWDGLFLATCDDEIRKFAESKGYPVLMTSDRHTRALDRVAEAADICGIALQDTDIVVCVQGDEPMLSPKMIEAVITPIKNDDNVNATILTMPIVDKKEYLSPDNVKLVHDVNGDVLYTSRAPIPYTKEFSPELGALRIHGIFGFRKFFLKKFTDLPESSLEMLESCDSNRICENILRQRVAKVPYQPTFAVDSPEDIAKVEASIKMDPYWGKY